MRFNGMKSCTTRIVIIWLSKIRATAQFLKEVAIFSTFSQIGTGQNPPQLVY
jgi:hypothetical protein